MPRPYKLLRCEKDARLLLMPQQSDSLRIQTIGELYEITNYVRTEKTPVCPGGRRGHCLGPTRAPRIRPAREEGRKPRHQAIHNRAVSHHYRYRRQFILDGREVDTVFEQQERNLQCLQRSGHRRRAEATHSLDNGKYFQRRLLSQ